MFHTLTRDAIDSLKAELETLNQSRPALVAELARARDLGDRSENAAYRVARQKLSRCDSRVRYLQKTLHYTRPLAPPRDITRCSAGHHVTLLIGEKKITYRLVESIQADITKGDLSTRSPLGRSLIGHVVGDRLTYHAPSGPKDVTLLQMEWSQ